MIYLEALALFIFIAGFVIGLGAVTVIDMLGFLGRKSSYWTETTIRAHKVTKPLIWIGTLLAIGGGTLFYYLHGTGNSDIWIFHTIAAVVLVLNGSFLSFYISPLLIETEKEGKAAELLPFNLQHVIIGSFIISFVGWWLSLLMLILFLI